MQVIECDERVLEAASDVAMRNEESGARSPFEGVPRVTLNITTAEIVELIHECRAGV